MKQTIRGPLTDAARAWAFIGDTDHLNRLAANPALEMRVEPDEHDYPAVRGTLIGPGPIRHTYAEVDSRWIHHLWFEQERVFEGPLLKRTHYTARLLPEEGGVVPEITMEVEATHPLAAPLVHATTRRSLAAWAAELRALPPPGGDCVAETTRALPRAVLEALDRWRRVSGAPFVERAAGLLQTARAAQLRVIRPFALADAWKLPRREALISMLEGTKAGALEVYWAMRCPRCDAQVGMTPELSDVADHAECPSCRIHFGTDLSDNVEVIFAAHPSIRPPPTERFCTLYPADRPDVLLLLTLQPGSTEEHTLTLPPGRWFLGAGGAQPDVELVTDPAGPETVDWDPEAGPGPRPVAAGRVRLRLDNPTGGRLRVQLSGRTDALDRVSAAYLSTMPEYRRTFGPQMLAPNARVTVRAMTILFTDLTGSAALYHEHGDAQAFRLVHDHFGVLTEVVERFGGVRIKTIGDALMAAFVDPAAGLSAALAMQDHFTAWRATLDLDRPPGLRVGLHFGPVMAVHTDQAGLDFFGGTVNLAARCQGASGAGEVVWTEALQDSPRVQEVLEAQGSAVTAFEAEVKGIPGKRRLFRTRP